ncbi:unnamed protein product [Amoebophrya sp. A120]|nr:unnamed protein product [Amoebophrya sp. A120]|eukprot:GSA120T00014927001.1
MPASPGRHSPSRGPREGDFKAGPVCGGRVLQPKEDFTVKEIAIPTSMQKTLIFVVDLSDAKLMDPELKSLDDMKDDLIDAMGVASSKKEFEVILAGYEGHERCEIVDTQTLQGFFERMEISKEDDSMNALFSSANQDGKGEKLNADQVYGPNPAHNNDPAKKAALEKDYPKHKSDALDELVVTKEQLAELRLGSVITKIQMQKFLKRLLQIQKDSLQMNFEKDTLRHALQQSEEKVDVQKELVVQEQEKYFALESSIEERVLGAIAEARTVFEQDKQKEMQKQRDDLQAKFNREQDQMLAEAERKLKECAAPLEAKIAELDTALQLQAESLKTAEAELKASKDGVEKMTKELEVVKSEKATVENQLKLLESELGAARDSLAQLQAKVDKQLAEANEKAAAAESAAAAKLAAAEEKKKREEERREREAAAAKAAEERKRQAEEAELQRKQAEELAKLKEDMEVLAKSLEEAYRIFDDYGIPIPGRTTQGHDARTFKWKITKLEEKIADYAKDRPCMSQEFTLWGLRGMQVEWYPNGVENSFPGWSAVKLRIPTMQSRCKVSVKWRVIFGNNLWVGPRTDEFCEQYWWCRKGVINWPNFVKTELLKQQIDEKGAITMTIDIIKATITPVDERGIALSGLPKRMPQVLATQSAAQLHSIALGGGFNSVQSKTELADYDIQLIICGEPFDDPQLFNLIKRYIKQTHLAIDNNVHGISSKNLDSPRYNSSPCTLRPRTSQSPAGSSASRPRTQGGNASLAWASSPTQLRNSGNSLMQSPTQRPGTSAGTMLLPSMDNSRHNQSTMSGTISNRDEFFSPLSNPNSTQFFDQSSGFPSLDASPARKRMGGLPLSPTRSPKRH